LIGATIDVPALRIDMTGNPSVEKLLGRVRSTVAAALTHQDVPFERITPQLQRPRPSAGPLFRVVFSFFPETPHGQLQLPGVTVTFLEEIINELSRPDLYLVIWENQTVAGGALAGYWMHKKDIFEAETAASMNDQLIAVLAAMVRDPAQTVDEALMRAH
jgi:non-ribosomal peptide synthetase component F